MIDLHCHSTVSDGKLPPAEVVRLAKSNGCTLLSLTDHDHTGGLAEARAEAERLGLAFVNGVEVSVTWRGRTVHIVGLDFDEHNESLQNLLVRVRQGRLQRLENIATKLAKKGINGAYEGALALAANLEMASRTHIAEFLIQEGHVRNKQQAFTKYLGDGKSCSVKHEWADLAECVAAITAAGGIAVIAHPMRYDLSATAKRNLFEEFKAAGGAAIEVHSGNCSKNDRLNYALLAERYGLLASAGSDFHRPNDFSGGVLGACPELPESCRPVWQMFQQAKC
ncbi:PHP domain-containing protein [Neisseria animalis]|uniref:PHP domain-containing protein n=1 Tax=Neisseria animalis TaxID=492 RepID=A0A5P3MST9_NEIAN|nr:PHP domain-containing protein [Neisseria animalis]QEY23709.1 PHP domain-containing protein [Neisseria animalis]ROW32851.1 PHP domain-containing protein [Neisseria animalis]VEE09532.1 putative metal-dependent phosphoesterase [Neisseria animalis]